MKLRSDGESFSCRPWLLWVDVEGGWVDKVSQPRDSRALITKAGVNGRRRLAGGGSGYVRTSEDIYSLHPLSSATYRVYFTQSPALEAFELVCAAFVP
jgi:hypothetical protein